MSKKIVSGIIFFKNIIFVIIGFPIIVEINGKLEMKRIKTKIYPVILIIISIATGIKKAYSKIDWTTISFPNMVFVSMIIAESACGIIGLMIYSSIFDGKKLKLYENYKTVDKYLYVGEHEHSKHNRMMGITYAIYYIVIFFVNTYDFYNWKKGFEQLILLWKITMIDLMILQFYEEIVKWKTRLQIFNKKIQKLAEIKSDSKTSKFCRMPNDINNSSIVELTKVYEKIWESINFIGKQFDYVVSINEIKIRATGHTWQNICFR